jgi:hypothetical protein
MRAMAQRTTPTPDEAAGPTETAARPATPLPVLVDGKVVSVAILDEAAIAVRTQGVCTCGACHGGRHPDSAADYF